MKKIVVDTHVGSYGVIIQDGKIALIKKARGGYKGLYDLPGGGIEHDETPLEALTRELMEEIGVSIVKAELLDAVSKTFKWDVNDKLIQDLHHIGILYRVEIESDELKTDADGLDSLGGEWKDIDKVKEEDVSPFTWMALKKLGYK
jgi:hydrolase, NUDIX family